MQPKFRGVLRPLREPRSLVALLILMAGVLVVFSSTFYSTPISYLDPFMYYGYSLTYAQGPEWPAQNWIFNYKESRVPWIWLLAAISPIENLATGLVLLAAAYVVAILILLCIVWSPRPGTLRVSLALSLAISPLVVSSGGFLYHNTLVTPLMLALITVLGCWLLRSDQAPNWPMGVAGGLSVLILTTNLTASPTTLGLLFGGLLLGSFSQVNKRRWLVHSFRSLLIGAGTTVVSLAVANLLVGRSFIFFRAQIHYSIAALQGTAGSEQYNKPIQDWIGSDRTAIIALGTLVALVSLRQASQLLKLVSMAQLVTVSVYGTLQARSQPIFSSEYMVSPLTVVSLITILSFVIIELVRTNDAHQQKAHPSKLLPIFLLSGFAIYLLMAYYFSESVSLIGITLVIVVCAVSLVHSHASPTLSWLLLAAASIPIIRTIFIGDVGLNDRTLAAAGILATLGLWVLFSTEPYRLIQAVTVGLVSLGLLLIPQPSTFSDERCQANTQVLQGIRDVHLQVRSQADAGKLVYVWGEPDSALLVGCQQVGLSDLSNLTAQMGFTYLGPAFPQVPLDRLPREQLAELSASGGTVVLISGNAQNDKVDAEFAKILGMNPTRSEIIRVEEIPEVAFSVLYFETTEG